MPITVTSLSWVTAFFPVGQWQNSPAVKLTFFKSLGFCFCVYMLAIFCASRLTDINKCVIRLSQCDTEVLPMNGWKSEGMFTLRSGVQSSIPEATGGLDWKVCTVQLYAGTPVWLQSIIATVSTDLCLRKEPCGAFITSGTGPWKCCYPGSGHWLHPAAPYLSHIHCPSGF